MKRKILPVVLLFIVVLLVYFAFTSFSPASEPSNVVSNQNPVSPELLRDRILSPAISFHPGTAGSSLGAAQVAAEIIEFITDYQLRFMTEAEMNQLMDQAYSLLGDEEQGWFQENLPQLIGLIDSVFSNYSELSGLFGDAGADSTIRSALANDKAPEDWARVRPALEQFVDNAD